MTNGTSSALAAPRRADALDGILDAADRPLGMGCPVFQIDSEKSLHAAEQDREDVRAARANWKQEQPQLDPSKFVFIDETGTSTNMTRLRGRGS